jgi:PAS domain S-box-containing protein
LPYFIHKKLLIWIHNYLFQLQIKQTGLTPEFQDDMPYIESLSKEELKDLVKRLRTEMDLTSKKYFSWPFTKGIREKKTDDAKKLEESEQKYRFLFEKAPVGIFRSTSEGKLIDANPHLAKIFGFDSVEEMLLEINDLSTQLYADPERRAEFIQQLKARGEVENFEFKAILSNGSHSWLSMNARVSQLSGSTEFILEGFLTDVTEKKNAEVQILNQNNELRELNATKDKFFTIIAHDLRNPFNGMLALSMLLLKNYEEYESNQVKELLDLINQSAERGVKLLENLLEWSRAQTGKIAYTPEKFNLADLLNQSISLLANQAEKKKIQIRSLVPADLEVYADKNMIFTVLRNLISNSIKFTFKDGDISIDASTIEGGFVKVTVRDNGMGIMPEYQELLFKLARNFSTRGTANESGTGLGLILCKDFIDKNGGTIWVESVYEKGSDFIFTIPSDPLSPDS